MRKKKLRDEEEIEMKKLKENDANANVGIPIFQLPTTDIASIEKVEEDYEKEMEAEVHLRIKQTPIDRLVNESTKIKLMKDLLLNHKKSGHRTLIFSQYTRMLDIVERVIKENLKFKYLRIDGSITSAKERSARVDQFNNNETFSCFLLTTQVGGIGLTLTAASRVILLDANWNPALDNQAVDRCYRIGQCKNVVVYRLISCETIEEKIYRKQVFKNTLSKNVQEKSNQYRYFNDAELREMLSLPEDVHHSKTCDQLQKLHTENRQTYTELIRHVEELENMENVVGITDHDQLFQKEADDNLDMAKEEEIARIARERYERLQMNYKQLLMEKARRRHQEQVYNAMINSHISQEVAESLSVPSSYPSLSQRSITHTSSFTTPTSSTISSRSLLPPVNIDLTFE